MPSVSQESLVGDRSAEQSNPVLIHIRLLSLLVLVMLQLASKRLSRKLILLLVYIFMTRDVHHDEERGTAVNCLIDSILSSQK